MQVENALKLLRAGPSNRAADELSSSLLGQRVAGLEHVYERAGRTLLQLGYPLAARLLYRYAKPRNGLPAGQACKLCLASSVVGQSCWTLHAALHQPAYCITGLCLSRLLEDSSQLFC